MPRDSGAWRYGLLVLATAVWGFGFVATQATLVELHPLWSNALRFSLAAPVALLLFRRRIATDRATVVAAAVASLLLVGTFTFQTWGLKYTTVGRSSLITGLYAVFTPLLAPLFRAPWPNGLHVAAAALALAGLWVLSGAPTDWDGGGLNLGDALTLGCALVTVGHIHVVARVVRGRDPLALNAMQLAFAALWCTVLALASGEPVPRGLGPTVAASLGYLSVFSSILAYGIQMVAQQSVSPSTAATLFLLEAPFGVLCGALFLGERLGAVQAAGGALMLAGCALSVRADAAR